MREAGARVRENFLLRDAGLDGVDPRDGRQIEVVASGLPVCNGVPIAVDVTLVSPVGADGTAHRGAALRPGTCFRPAEKRKAQTYPELVGSSRLRLVTVATEIGGRVNAGGRALLEAAAHARARGEPAPLRKAAAHRWYGRWLTLVGVAAQDAVAASLVDDGLALVDVAEGFEPTPVDLWLDGGSFPLGTAASDNTGVGNGVT